MRATAPLFTAAFISTPSLPNMTSSAHSHAALMDRIYIWQKDIYDVTRKFYLLGRDEMLASLNARAGERILEIGCGTARNLIKAQKLYPHAHFYGLDVSTVMLEKAQEQIDSAGLSAQINLAQANACDPHFLPAHFPRSFDKIYFSYTLSMIPQAHTALSHALSALTSQGMLVIIDFGQCEAMPSLFKFLLFKWLALFSVRPHAELSDHIAALAHRFNMTFSITKPFHGYALLARIAAPPEGAVIDQPCS
jgi:S-adenosylmethionine-diacylgycerolhomoserine-N-methlytransferase